MLKSSQGKVSDAWRIPDFIERNTCRWSIIFSCQGRFLMVDVGPLLEPLRRLLLADVLTPCVDFIHVSPDMSIRRMSKRQDRKGQVRKNEERSRPVALSRGKAVEIHAARLQSFRT